ncbi:MAG: cytochrome P450 [Pseudomonadota bacterium]
MFDPASTEFSQDPYAVYGRLRERPEPLYFSEMGCLLLARYSEVEQAARDTRCVRSLEAFLPQQQVAERKRDMNWHDMPNHQRFVQFSLLDSDGAVHDRLRLLVLQELSHKFIEAQRSHIQRCVDLLLDELLQRRSIDFIEDFACHIPGRVIGRILGVPDEDCGQLRIWSDNVVQFFDVGRTDAHKALAEDATTEFFEYLDDLVKRRKSEPGDDLLSRLVLLAQAGKMDEIELISTCMLLLMAGHGSTIDVLGTGLNACLQFQEQKDQLWREPGLIHTAVQEMFRFEPPLPFFHRYAAEEFELNGVVYPIGTKFGLLYGSANRDPEAFPNPDEFDIRREPNRHLAFGRGPLGGSIATTHSSLRLKTR